jgi:hypothetical protein
MSVLSTSLTRRVVAKLLSGTLLASVTIRAGVVALASRRRRPVVSFFLDQPYLDATALDMPYRPPQGVRGGQPLAAMSEHEFRSIAPYG